MSGIAKNVVLNYNIFMANTNVKCLFIFIVFSSLSLLLLVLQSEHYTRMKQIWIDVDKGRDNLIDGNSEIEDIRNNNNNDNDIMKLKDKKGRNKKRSMFVGLTNNFDEDINTQQRNYTLAPKIPSFPEDKCTVGRRFYCDLLIQGNTTEAKKAEVNLKECQKICTSPKTYIIMTKNCSQFISQRGYITEPLSTLENKFQIAYSIIMYQDVEQCERLLRSIYRPQNIHCIHVDSKSSDDVFQAMSKIADCFDNVFVTSKRYSVVWGTITVLEPEILCMRELYKRSKTWKYFINLTGQELPLRTNNELVQILKAYNGANDIRGSTARARTLRWAHAGPPPHGITPIKGPVHITASRGYVEFLLHDQRARDFLNWTRRTLIPDGTYFATMNHNPSLKVPGSFKGPLPTHRKKGRLPFLTRFKIWKTSKIPCYGTWKRNICIFGIGDLPELASRHELFANKFFINVNHISFDCVEEMIWNRTRDEYRGNRQIMFNTGLYSRRDFVLKKLNN